MGPLVCYRLSAYDTPVPPSPSSRSGRYHRAGGSPAHYWSLHPHTPWAEIYRWEGVTAPPPGERRRLWAARIHVTPTVITFDNAEDFGVQPGDLVADDHTACRALADRLRSLGTAAIQVPSAALPGTTNLVLLDDRILIDYDSAPVDPIDLPAAVAADLASGPPGVCHEVTHLGAPHAGRDAWMTGRTHHYAQPHADLRRP
jgi:hypothetical protein